ncbi:hypothetical protein MPH_00560 [Macrophomina phaseolina MS6]|uniref:Uncharacterized protein n=1 Tax=Macrophomina phaseolina (strain MS6) TaxID=1126212 RepID=K2SZN3_MACPH|nr:hypothetical protein MPH_00560 [Macrophomina phaseolina MS6]
MQRPPLRTAYSPHPNISIPCSPTGTSKPTMSSHTASNARPEPRAALSNLEGLILEKWDDPSGTLTELEWYALQSVIQQRTADGQRPPLEILKAAKIQLADSPFGVLDTPTWLQWRVAHPQKGPRTSPPVPEQQSWAVVPQTESTAPGTNADTEVWFHTFPSRRICLTGPTSSPCPTQGRTHLMQPTPSRFSRKSRLGLRAPRVRSGRQTKSLHKRYRGSRAAKHP